MDQKSTSIMHHHILYKPLGKTCLEPDLFKDFNRHQVVEKCWRKIDGRWILKHIPFIEVWDKKEFKELSAHLKNTLKTNGIVLGAFKKQTLIGFASLEGNIFGAKKYIQLSSIHITLEARGQKIGQYLFSLMAKEAKNRGADFMYISAHSSEETMAFYRKMGCVEASEYNQIIHEKEPFDCQLEYLLSPILGQAHSSI